MHRIGDKYNQDIKLKIGNVYLNRIYQISGIYDDVKNYSMEKYPLSENAYISIMKPSHKKTNPGVGMSSETLDWIGLIMTSPVQVIYHL